MLRRGRPRLRCLNPFTAVTGTTCAHSRQKSLNRVRRQSRITHLRLLGAKAAGAAAKVMNDTPRHLAARQGDPGPLRRVGRGPGKRTVTMRGVTGPRALPTMQETSRAAFAIWPSVRLPAAATRHGREDSLTAVPRGAKPATCWTCSPLHRR